MLNLLRGGVFLMALAAAFAFTEPQSAVTGQLFANVNGNWVPIPDVPPGTTYRCVGQQDICTAKFLNDDPSDMDNLIPSSVRPGEYAPI